MGCEAEMAAMDIFQVSIWPKTISIMITIDFKKIILDKIQKKGTFLNNYVKDRVFFGWQYHDDKGFHARIKHPRVRNSPCLTWQEARKIIMAGKNKDGAPDDYTGWNADVKISNAKFLSAPSRTRNK